MWTASEAHDVVKKVRQLGVFLQIYNTTFKTFSLMVEVWLISINVIFASVSVKYFQLREGLIATMACVMCMGLFKSMGGVYESSGDVYGCLQLFNADPSLKRYKRAYRPLRIQVGQFGHADMALCLTILSTILTNTATLVLTTK